MVPDVFPVPEGHCYRPDKTAATRRPMGRGQQVAIEKPIAENAAEMDEDQNLYAEV